MSMPEKSWQDRLFDYPNTATTAIVTVTNVSQVVAPADPLRRQLILMNDSGSVVFVKFGLGATTSNFTVRIAPNTHYEIAINGYGGVVSAVRASGTGPLIVTSIYYQ